VGAPTNMETNMTNNTTNETNNNTSGDGNLTELLESAEESGLLDSLMDDPVLMLLAALVLGLGAYAAYTIPAVKGLVFKYLKNNEAEVMTLLDKNLTKVQMKAFEKLDEAAQKHVKDSIVRNVLLTAWDEKDDELAALVKSKVKDSLVEGKSL
jgi:hypothetical protein|tara:strand:+ start:94 stop:552 length:459 start_codon:yes stop_codon:yes gene_type:complete